MPTHLSRCVNCQEGSPGRNFCAECASKPLLDAARRYRRAPDFVLPPGLHGEHDGYTEQEIASGIRLSTRGGRP